MSLEKMGNGPLVFKNIEGRESVVRIMKERIIAQSDISDISRVEVGGKRRGTFVLKEYLDYNEKPARYWAERGFKAFEALKRAGVDTWTTYRLEEREPSILMSDGERDDSLVVGFNSSDSLAMLAGKVKEIDGFETTVNEAKRQAELATNNDIELSLDAWLARINLRADGSITMRCFIGDLEMVRKVENPDASDKEKILKQNYSSLRNFLRDLFSDLFGEYTNEYSHAVDGIR